MRILINVPSLKLPGGVANHYKGLLPYWKHSVRYNVIGGRYRLPRILCLIYDYVKFTFIIAVGRYDVVLLNPSLGQTAIVRDAIFLAISKLRGLRVVVFFHGWDNKQQRLIDSDPQRMRRLFKNADAFIVLANQFCTKLASWGLVSPIYLSSTKVDDRLLDEFCLEKKVYGKKMLFLARLDPDKGLLIALQAFSAIVSRFSDASFIIAGDGEDRKQAEQFVKSLCIPNVSFVGNVSGEALKKVFSDADLYILPTTYGEGMPTSVLEAMAFALPVLTRPVGGLQDFFENGMMGLMNQSVDPAWYANAACNLLADPIRMKEIGSYNYAFAKENFYASKVVCQLESIIEEVVNVP